MTAISTHLPTFRSILLAFLLGGVGATLCAQDADSTLTTLRANLRDKNEYKVAIATGDLLAMGKDAADQILREAIDGEDAVVSGRVLGALAGSWDRAPARAVKLLVDTLDRESLGAIAQQRLLEIVDTDANNSPIRYNPIALEALIAHIKDRERPVPSRILAVDVLREVYDASLLSPDDVVVALFEMMDGTRGGVSDAIDAFLYHMTGQDLDSREQWRAWWEEHGGRSQPEWFRRRLEKVLASRDAAVDESVLLWQRLLLALHDQPAEHLKAVRDAQQHKDPRVRVHSVNERGWRAREGVGAVDEAVAELKLLLANDPSLAVRIAVARQLKAIGSKLATPALLAGLTAPATDLSLRRELVDALGDIGDTAAVATLVALVEAREPAPLVVPAVVALGKLRFAGKSCTEAVCAFLRDELAKAADKRDQKGVERAVECIGNLRFEAYREQESLAVETLIGPVISHATPYNRRSAVEHLKRFPREEVVACLIAILESADFDEATRAQAVESLGSIAASRAESRARIAALLFETAEEEGAVSANSLRFLRVLVEEEQMQEVAEFTTLEAAIAHFQAAGRGDFVIAAFDGLKHEEPAAEESREEFWNLLDKKARALCRAREVDPDESMFRHARLFEDARSLFELLASERPDQGYRMQWGQCLLEMGELDAADQLFRELLTAPEADVGALWAARLAVIDARIAGGDAQWPAAGSTLLAELNGKEELLPPEVQEKVSALRTRIEEEQP